MPENRGILQVVSSAELHEREQEDIRQAQQVEVREQEDDTLPGRRLASHIRHQFERMRNHRSGGSDLQNRLLRALRVFKGQYDNAQLAQIRQFGGSEVYGRLVSTKARGATALLRDIYFQADRPWGLKPTPSPTIPDDISDSIPRLVEMETSALAQAGMPVDDMAVQQRTRQLQEAARAAAKDKARDDAERAEKTLDDIMVEGGFYQALAEIMVDLPLFPYVCLKGPMVRILPRVKWVDGEPQIIDEPRLLWDRVSPFDVYFTPGVSNISDANICERLRWTRRDLNDLIGLPGWDEEAVRASLRDYDTGLRDWMDPTDSTRAQYESREDPNYNQSEMIDALEFHGTVQGQMLLDFGYDEEVIEDPDRDYMVEAWICGQHLLKIQLNPSPRKRHPYFITSFEKVPGTPVGNALPDMLSDIEEVANASLRALVNNMAMASGPQVVVDSQRLSPEEDTSEIYPWKIWVASDELGNSSRANPPVNFYQPGSNAQELLGIYHKMTEIADEVSAIPRYITGSGAPGGAGRTASGLSMLMGNASKILQQVASNVDVDILHDMIQQLYDLVMVTRAGAIPLRGDESIQVRGASAVMAREAERARQLEFLGLTANPIDMQITGLEGRAEVLRAIANDLGLRGGSVVPSREDMKQRQEQALQAQAANAAVGAQGDGDAPPAPADSTAPVQNLIQPGFNMGG